MKENIKLVLAALWLLLCIWGGFYFVKDVCFFHIRVWWSFPYIYTVLGVGGIGVYLIIRKEKP